MNKMTISRHILEDLYSSEINFEISSFWDAGFDWKLGDTTNGYLDEGNAASFLEACQDLERAAVEHCPDSSFADAQRKTSLALYKALKNLMNGIETGAITSDHDEVFTNARYQACHALALSDGKTAE